MAITINGSGTVSGITAGLTAAAMPAGSVLQVLQSTRTDLISTTSATYADVLTQAITPSSASNKILIFYQGMECTDAGDGNSYSSYKLLRGSTSIYNGTASNSAIGVSSGRYGRQSSYQSDPVQIMYLDSPSTTSATTYKIQYNSVRGSSWRVSVGGTYADDGSAYARVPTNLILMEVAG